MSRKEGGYYQPVPTTCAARRVMKETRKRIERDFDRAYSANPDATELIDSGVVTISDSLMLEIVMREDIAELAAHNSGGFGRASINNITNTIEWNGRSTAGAYLYEVRTNPDPQPLYNLLGGVCALGIELEESGVSRHNEVAVFSQERAEVMQRIERATGCNFPEVSKRYPYAPIIPVVEFGEDCDDVIEAMEIFRGPIQDAIPPTVDLFDVTPREILQETTFIY